MAIDPPPKPKRGKNNRWYEGEEFNKDKDEEIATVGDHKGGIPARELGAGGRLVGPRLPQLDPAPGQVLTRVGRKRQED